MLFLTNQHLCGDLPLKMADEQEQVCEIFIIFMRLLPHKSMYCDSKVFIMIFMTHSSVLILMT